MSLRVLYVIDHLGCGGAQVVLKNILSYLDRSKVEPLVYALRQHPKPIWVNAEVVTLTGGRYSFKGAKEIARLCRERKIDLVHANLQKANILSLLSGVTVPVVIHEHGEIFSQSWVAKVYRFLLRSLRHRMRGAIGISQAIVERVAQVTTLSSQQVVTITNFIDTQRFDASLYQRDEIRRQWGMEDNTWVLGFVGRLDECKGADVLVNAMASLIELGMDVHAVIVGEGGEYASLKQLIQSLALEQRVKLLGLAENPAQLMVGLDVGVVPSRREGFGMVAAEYLAMGVPVIASRTGGLPEVVDDGENGILVQPDDPGAIVEAFKELSKNPEGIEAMRASALAKGRRLGGEQQIRQLQDCYQQWCKRLP